jgi:hypothetical protein
VRKPPADPYAATAPIATDTVPLPRHGEAKGLALSPLFDSAAGLRRLLAERSTVASPRPPTRWRRPAWSLAYLAAAAVAVAIALA